MEDYAIGNSEQTFKLVASLLQKLANLQIFENQEYHMDKLNPILKKEMPRLKKFVDALCDTEKKDSERTASGITKMEYADETPIARLCTIIEKYSSILETGLPDRTVAVFLRELEDLTNEMQFLNKKFKTDQKRTRKEIVAEETEKRLRNSEESPKRKTFTLSPKKNNRASRDQITVFPEYNPIPPFTKEEVDPKVWAYVESLLQALEHAKSASSSLISSPSQSGNSNSGISPFSRHKRIESDKFSITDSKNSDKSDRSDSSKSERDGDEPKSEIRVKSQKRDRSQRLIYKFVILMVYGFKKLHSDF